MRWWSLSHKDRFRFFQKVAKYHAEAELRIGGTNCDAHNAEARYIELLRNTAIRLVRLRNIPRGNEREDATMWFFKSFDARMAAVLVSNYNRPEKFPYQGFDPSKGFGGRLPKHEVEVRAEKAGQIRSTEPLQKILKPKGEGKFRTVYAFGIVRTIQQTLCRWLIEAQAPRNEYDFSQFGKESNHGAAQAIGSALLEEKFYWVTGDIKNAFPSIRRAHLKKYVDLDKRILRYVAIPNLASYIINDVTNPDAAPMPPGPELPQGAAHSSAALSAIIGGCLSSIDLGKVQPIVSADNFGFGAQNFSDALCAFKAFEKELSYLPTGGLLVHEKSFQFGLYDPDGPLDQHANSAMHDAKLLGFSCYFRVDFCGYRVFLQSPVSLFPIFRISQKAWNRFYKKVMTEAEQQKLTPDEVAETLFPNWVKSFKLCKPAEGAIHWIATNASLKAMNPNHFKGGNFPVKKQNKDCPVLVPVKFTNCN